MLDCDFKPRGGYFMSHRDSDRTESSLMPVEV